MKPKIAHKLICSQCLSFKIIHILLSHYITPHKSVSESKPLKNINANIKPTRVKKVSP